MKNIRIEFNNKVKKLLSLFKQSAYRGIEII